jgi:hypothetical protein
VIWSCSECPAVWPTTGEVASEAEHVRDLNRHRVDVHGAPMSDPVFVDENRDVWIIRLNVPRGAPWQVPFPMDEPAAAEDWRPPVDRPFVPGGHAHPPTALAAAARALPASGTRRRAIYDAVLSAAHAGMTDKELEVTLAGDHEAVSGSRNGLMNDGWIVDSGLTRPTPKGNPSIVWIAAEFAVSARPLAFPAP